MMEFWTRCLEWVPAARARWAELNPFVRLVIAALLAALGFVALSRPASEAGAWLAARRNLQRAVEALGKGNMAQARDHARAVLQYDLQKLEALRVMLAASDALHDPVRLHVSAAVLDHPDATRGDRARAFEVLARIGPLATVGSAWTRLHHDERADPTHIAAFGHRLLDEGKPGQAALLLQGTNLDQPTEAVFLLTLRILEAKGGQEAWLEIQRLLVNRVRGTTDGTPLGDECIDLWERIPRNLVDPASASVLPDDGPPRLRLLRRRILQGDRRIEADDPEILQWIAAGDANLRLPLARLLADFGLRREAIALFVAKAPRDVAEYEWLRRARESRLEWDAWHRYLSSPMVENLPPALVQADRAVACDRLGMTAESADAWRKAIAHATGRGPEIPLVGLSRRVSAWMPTRAHEAMLMAVRGRSEGLPLLEDQHDLIGFLHREDREVDLLDVLKTYRALEPQNPVAVTRLAYLSLLMDEVTPSAAADLVEPFLKELPDSPHPHIVAIAAALLGNQPEEAAARLAACKADFRQSPPIYQWIAQLAGSKGLDASQAPANTADLLPCEQAFIAKLSEMSVVWRAEAGL